MMTRFLFTALCVFAAAAPASAECAWVLWSETGVFSPHQMKSAESWSLNTACEAGAAWVVQ